MPTPKTNPAQPLADALVASARLIDQEFFDDAWQALLEAERLAQEQQVRSGFLNVLIARVASHRNDLAKAVPHIMAALALDPVHPHYLALRAEIRERVVASLKLLQPQDEQVSQLCLLLVDLNAVDAFALTAYSKHLALKGEAEKALNLARRAVEVGPLTVGVILRFAELLEQAGRHEEAAAQRRHAAELPTVFGGEVGSA